MKSLPKSCIQFSRRVYQNIRFLLFWGTEIKRNMDLNICNKETVTVISAAWETISALDSCFIIKHLLVHWLEEKKIKVKGETCLLVVFFNVIPHAIGPLPAEFINTKFYLISEQQAFTGNNWNKNERVTPSTDLSLKRCFKFRKKWWPQTVIQG